MGIARLEQVVALKTMTSLAGDETAHRRFWREARTAASVNHPNVCQLYEIGEDAGELFIAMALLEGEALAACLWRLVVLPFHILRRDPETAFLAFSFPDAIATSLSRLGSLVVRSSATAARLAGGRRTPRPAPPRPTFDRADTPTIRRMAPPSGPTLCKTISCVT